jgi:TM2 domain-containing membrane protein YozV
MTTPPPPPGQDPYQPPEPPPYPPQPPGQDPYQAQQPPPYPPQPPTFHQPTTWQTSFPPQYPTSGAGQPYSPYAAGYPQSPMVPGYDPVTGQPYSDKSKVAAGLLQLLPGFFFAFGGIGRLYAGYTSLGVAQIVVSVLGWICFICGFFLIIPFVVTIGAWLWAIIDGIVLLAGRPVDGQGRLLRS